MRFVPPRTDNEELDFFLAELARAFNNKTGLLPTEADGLYDPVGTADAAIAAHELDADPHTQYVLADGTRTITDIQAISKSVSGSAFTALSLRNPVASTVSTAVQLELRPNPTANRGALIRSTQSNSGDYATLGFYIVNNGAPSLAFDVNRFSQVTFYQDLFAGALNSSGVFSNGGRLILIRNSTSHEAWIEFQNGGTRYWYQGLTPDAAGDYVIRRYNDAGVLQDTPIKITRASGQIDVFGDILMGSNSAGKYLRFNYLTTDAASRAWRLRQDVGAFGDFDISTETAQGNNTFVSRLNINPAGTVYTNSAVDDTLRINTASGTGSPFFGWYQNHTRRAYGLYNHSDSSVRFVNEVAGLTMSLSSSGALINTAHGLGYGAGGGGSVTQGTSATTAVTLNTPSGRITGYTVSLSALTATEFVVNNSVVGQYDSVVVSPVSGFNGADRLLLDVTNVTSGAFTVRITNLLGSATANAARVFNFAVIKGSNS